MENKNNNYAFIDGQNLNLGIKSLGWNLNFKKFRILLRQKYNVTVAYYFIGFIPANKNLYSWLKRCGYTLVFKPVVTDGKNNPKGNIDADLVLRVMIEYNNLVIEKNKNCYIRFGKFEIWNIIIKWRRKKMENVKKRPSGITILAVLQIIFGILFLLGAIGMFLVASLADVADLEDAIGEDAPDWIVDNFAIAFGLLGVLFLIIGIVGLVLGYGYMKGIGWAWTVGIILAVLGIIGDLIEPIIDRTTDVLASSIIGIIIALLIIYYLTRPHVKAFFGKT